MQLEFTIVHTRSLVYLAILEYANPLRIFLSLVLSLALLS